ncbi:hypothetical protein E2320_014353, partial [Naja naja]
GVGGLLKAKCPLTLQMDEVAPKNHYKPGELSIGGIISEKTGTISTGITILYLIHTGIMKSPAGKVLVTTVLWDLSTFLKENGILYLNIHSIFSFVLKSNQLHPFLGNSEFYNKSIAGVYRDENEVPAVDLDIVNWLLHKSTVHRIIMGSLEKQGSLDFKFMLYPKEVAEIDKLNKGVGGLLKAKCLLTLQMDEVAPKNHYKLGELSIGGIISETQTFFQLISFEKCPLSQIE